MRQLQEFPTFNSAIDYIKNSLAGSTGLFSVRHKTFSRQNWRNFSFYRNDKTQTSPKKGWSENRKTKQALLAQASFASSEQPISPPWASFYISVDWLPWLPAISADQLHSRKELLTVLNDWLMGLSKRSCTPRNNFQVSWWACRLLVCVTLSQPDAGYLLLPPGSEDMGGTAIWP